MMLKMCYLIIRFVADLHGSPEHFLCNDASLLNMIGKGFVLLRINNSPGAFFIIKPLAYRDWFLKWAIVLKNRRKVQTRSSVYVAE